jgi:hypothetical protein
MHTKDQLAAALRAIGLDTMADKAATGYYHDYLSPLDLPEIMLVTELNVEATKVPEQQRGPIFELRDRVINGDFDATLEEADAWAESAEGQEAMHLLIRDKDRLTDD